MSLIVFARSLRVLIWFAAAMQRWSTPRLLARTHLDPSTRETVGALVRYSVLVSGFMIVMQTIGINLTSLSVIASKSAVSKATCCRSALLDAIHQQLAQREIKAA
ncbi:hypothetical protein [Hydrocarboniphaga sp.]|uniref:hypothetical protein n=1 Tax=Hydrocarboniphaga sp. TaxID=2033016 RepID=UPI003D09AAF2